MTLAFAGHRPEKLPWGTEEADPRCVALKLQLRRELDAFADLGYTCFLCGMARGCDFYAAEAVLTLAQSRPELRLEAFLPCPSQPDSWQEKDRIRYEELLKQCHAVHMVEPVYSEGCMLRRNRRMVEQCDALLTVWDGTEGGTAAAIRHARRMGKVVKGLWL